MACTQYQKSDSFKNKQINIHLILVASTGVAIWHIILSCVKHKPNAKPQVPRFQHSCVSSSHKLPCVFILMEILTIVVALISLLDRQ